MTSNLGFQTLSDNEKVALQDGAVKEAVEKYITPFITEIYNIDYSVFHLPNSLIGFHHKKNPSMGGFMKVYHYQDNDNHNIEAVFSKSNGQDVLYRKYYSFKKNSLIQVEDEELIKFLKACLEQLKVLFKKNDETDYLD